MTPISSASRLEMSETAVWRQPRNRSKTPSKRRRKGAPVYADDDEIVRPAVGTLSRTKTLLLAALKVWELKNGIRD
jgi:hypothetical protein